MSRPRKSKPDVREAVALALSFADGLRISGAAPEAQADAVLDHLARSGFVVLPRVGRGSRVSQPATAEPTLTSAGVRTARASAGLARSTLARMAGIKRSTLRDFESGRRVPQQRTLDAISAALDQAAQPASSPDR